MSDEESESFIREALNRQRSQASASPTRDFSKRFGPSMPKTPGNVGAIEATQQGTSRAENGPGLARGRTRWREPVSLKSVLVETTRKRNWERPQAMGSVMVKWPIIVGANVAAHCTIETFEEKRLVVRCDTTAWCKQLQLLLPLIQRRISEEVGPHIVDQVIIRPPVAPSWKKGRFSVKGRGPRDTYG